MKNLLYIILAINILFVGVPKGHAQNNIYGFEWIDYSKPHYKFKIGEAGIYRITYEQLNSMNMGALPVGNLRIYRDGKQVPIYISTNTNNLNSGDYIEFYGYGADGEIDKQLYLQPEYQPNEELNLITDTAVYFLSYRDGGVPLRIDSEENIIPNPEPTNAGYLYQEVEVSRNIRSSTMSGKSYSSNENFYASDFDEGTGYAYRNASAMNNNFVVTSLIHDQDISGRLLINVNNSRYNRDTTEYEILFNNKVLLDTLYASKYTVSKYELIIPGSYWVSSSYQNLKINDSRTNKGVFKAKLIYPRNLVFTGAQANKVDFIVPANTAYLSMQFNTNQGQSILLDIKNNKRYIGNVSGNKVRYNLGNKNEDISYIMQNANHIDIIDEFELVNLVDLSYSFSADYIILSNEDYIGKSPNYIEQYANYRSSVEGGGHNVAIVNVNDLYEQFSFGYKFHSSAIRNYLKYAQEQSNNSIEHLFIIGKGLRFDRIYNYQNNPSSFAYEPIPTYGYPGSDNLFSTFDGRKPTIATGRLSSWSNEDLGKYLSKVQSYELAIKFSEDEAYSDEALWKKHALHVAGGSDQALQSFLVNSLNSAEAKYKSGQTGGKVTLVRKISTDPMDQVNNEVINTMFEKGINLITFFGHASSSGFDYNLNTPELYEPNPRFPHFLALGCDVANIFALNHDLTIGENYLKAEGGSLTMIASNHYGYTSSLNQYLQGIYNEITKYSYGETFGKQYLNNIQKIQQQSNSRFMDIHLQTILFQGDPGLRFAQDNKADLAILEEKIKLSEDFLMISQESFDITVPVYNFGKSVEDSILITISSPILDSIENLQDSIWLESLYAVDTISFTIPLEESMVGMQNFIIKIDADNRHEELTKGNNTIQKTIFIASEDVVPLYPNDFGIVYNSDSFSLKASTMDMFAQEGNYLFEIDTTALFNSNFKKQTNITSSGGTLIWNPDVSLQDSMVYYWRVALEKEDTVWHERSFIYLENGSDGWNQSHYYQYLYDDLDAIKLPESTREFEFSSVSASYVLINKVISPTLQDAQNNVHILNDVVLDNSGCIHPGSLQIAVIDPITGNPWKWEPNMVPGTTGPCKNSQQGYLFEFSTASTATRNQAKDFIESIPDGHYIMVKNYIYGATSGANAWDEQDAEAWKGDTLLNGSNNSLYHTLLELGFDQIDEFDAKKVFLFFRKKGDDNYPISQAVSLDDEDKIILNNEFEVFKDSGIVKSTIIGPASRWESLLWNLDKGLNADESFMEIYGLTEENANPVFIKTSQNNTEDLNDISTEQYPYLQINWVSKNPTFKTSENLEYWRVLFDPLPELALSPNFKFSLEDSIAQGEKGNLSMAIHSLSDVGMDSIGFRVKILDNQNELHNVAYKKFAPLEAHDSLHINMQLDLTAYPGNGILIFEANPDLEQNELYYPNNIGRKKIFIASDKTNPLIDVTFDGVYILDKDIVSAKPAIDILLKDDNQYLALDDTSLFNIYIKHPNQNDFIEIPIDNNITTFYPANLSNGKNEARIEYRPHFLEDGVYTLKVEGKDKIGNKAGNGQAYEVRFTVINKSTITHVLNYPNPFSTSTQFLFTLTGAEIPTQFKIQILSVTGKVVKEITQNEFGPIRVGRNISEYRWDGTDEYGQLLGNGVYLYRLVTDINGESIEHRANAEIDKFFKNGYGKLYIMR